MVSRPLALVASVALVAGALAALPMTRVVAAPRPAARPVKPAAKAPSAPSRTAKRWLFIWRDMSDPKEVDRMIARFPRAQADGYNGVAFSYNIPPEKGPELKQAA